MIEYRIICILSSYPMCNILFKYMFVNVMYIKSILNISDSIHIKIPHNPLIYEDFRGFVTIFPLIIMYYFLVVLLNVPILGYIFAIQ